MQKRRNSIMGTMASQITCLTIVYWTHKGPVTRNMFPFDDVIMFKQVGDRRHSFNSQNTSPIATYEQRKVNLPSANPVVSKVQYNESKRFLCHNPIWGQISFTKKLYVSTLSLMRHLQIPFHDRSRLHWYFVQIFQLIINMNWFRQWLGHMWRNMASLCHNELSRLGFHSQSKTSQWHLKALKWRDHENKAYT